LRWALAQRSDLTAQTFLFADLSGFTALTEAHGDEQAADFVGGFCVAVRQLLAAHQTQEVKTIGDALMLRTGDSAAAIRLELCIVHDVGAQHGFPLVRVGMHTGPAVERGGDWFGATVNLAARVSAAAGGGEALLTEATKAAAGQVAGVELRERGRWSFRNVGAPVPVYAAIRQGTRSSLGLPIDPVCRMAVDPWHGGGRLTHQGVEYCFARWSTPARSPSTPAATPRPIDRPAQALIGMVAGSDNRPEPVDGRLVGELGAVAWPFVSRRSVRTPR
jgi:adenylate cyclase